MILINNTFSFFYVFCFTLLNLKVNAKILAWLLREAFNISLNIVISFTLLKYKGIVRVHQFSYILHSEIILFSLFAFAFIILN